MFVSLASVWFLLATTAASQNTQSEAPEATSVPAEKKPEVVWTSGWSVGVSQAGDHPLTRPVIEQRLARWIKKLPDAQLNQSVDLTRSEFRRAAREGLRRYALFIDRSASDVLVIQVLDEQELAGLASLDLQCPGCDVKGWEVRLNEGMSALIEALAPILKASEPKPNEAETEKSKGEASIAFQFRELGSGLKLVGVSVQLSQGKETICETLSEAKGKARCPDLAPGEYAWAASFSGYKAKTGTKKSR